MRLRAMSNTALGGALLAAMLAIASGERASAHQPRPGALPPPAAAEVGGPFELVDHKGRTVTDRDFRGRLVLVFFGFTHCPDACPLALQNMALALEALGAQADKVRVLFITVDRRRDTPEVLADYVANFHPNVIGLTGSQAQLAAVARAFHVRYREREAPGDDASASSYLVDHSAYIYVLGRNGRFRHAFHHAASADAIAAKLRALLAEEPGN